MEETLNALGEILLKALPTFFLVLALYIYLRKVFFQPLGRVLEARRQSTEGSKKRAEEIFRKAEQRAVEYEAALQAARSEIHRQQEQERRKALEQHAARVREARAQAEERLRQARQQIAKDVAVAKRSLAAQSETLAEQIMRAVLGKGSPA